MLTPFRLKLLTLCLTGVAAVAQESGKAGRTMSAFEAVGLLPAEEQAALARIEGRDGTPNPERWHLLLYDPAGEAGLREITVADGKIAGSHPVSQFAQSLAKSDVFAGNSLLFDSVHVARIAQEYCRTNGVTAVALHYSLRKGGSDAAPVWTVFCVNAKGEELGHIVVTAGGGAVTFHPGFAAEPLPEQLLDRPRPAPLSTANASPDSSRARPSTAPGPAPAPVPKRKPGSSSPATPGSPASPAGATPKPNLFQRVFGVPGR
jgi:hypothetical protein